MWKGRKKREIPRVCLSTPDLEKLEGLSTPPVGKRLFHTPLTDNPQKLLKDQRLELMLVLMAFTFSAKALSVFIFFSTCWME